MKTVIDLREEVLTETSSKLIKAAKECVQLGNGFAPHKEHIVKLYSQISSKEFTAVEKAFNIWSEELGLTVNFLEVLDTVLTNH